MGFAAALMHWPWCPAGVSPGKEAEEVVGVTLVQQQTGNIRPASALRPDS